MVEILFIIIVLGITIFVHELGHFATAKLMGISVEKFSIGWGPKIVAFKKGGTEYQISWLLFLGGYVKMEGENPQEIQDAGDKGFLNQPVYKRIIVAVSGVAMNMVLAVVLIWVVLTAGTDTLKTQVGKVKQGYPAAEAGIIKGDLITEINGDKVMYWEQLTGAIKENGGEPLEIKALRDGKKITATVYPVVEDTENIINDIITRPVIGIEPLAYLNVVESLDEKYPAFEAGLEPGDEITAVNNVKTDYWDEVAEQIKKAEGGIKLDVKRDGEEKVFNIKPKMEERKTADGEKETAPVLGIMPKGNFIKETYSPVKAAEKSVEKTVFFTAITVKAVYKMISGKMEPDVAGPVGVMHITYQVAKTGFVNLLMLFAIININLALVNILPILPLDGGLVLLFAVEGIIKRPVPLKIQEALMQAGWYLLIILIVFFTYKDILRLFGGD
ncbi:MAG: RIP metalloprotease RseP [Candidatus Goldiibacteriota bacterium]